MLNIVPYILAGYPNMQITIDILDSLNNIDNVKFIELGLPFSDPVADGPTIEKAHSISLKNKITIDSLLPYISSYSFSYDIYLMSYLNPIMSHYRGLDYLIDRLKNANVKGLIIPDLPLREIKNVSISYTIIPFVTPNSDEISIKYINNIISPPWVYYVMRYGITGIRKDVPYFDSLVKFKRLLKSELYAGFCISTKGQIKKIKDMVDGVIIGSLFMKMINENPSFAHIKIKEVILELGDV